MTKEEYVHKLVEEKYNKYRIDIPIDQLPWSGEIIETKLNTGQIELVDRMVEFTLCSLYSYYYIDRYAWTIDPKKGPIPLRLFDFQLKILEDFQNNSKVIFRKCLTESNFVMTDRGYISIKDVKVGDKIQTLEDGKIIWDEIIDFWKNNDTKECARIHLQNGSFVETTLDHKIMTTEGWKETQELRLKDEIISSFGSDHFGAFELEDDCLAALIGYYIADGKVRGNVFCNSNMKYLNEVMEAGLFFKDIVPKMVLQKKEQEHHSDNYHVLLTTDNKRSNSYLDFSRRFGLATLSSNRCLTPELMNLNKRQMSILLNRLFAGDGWYTKNYRTDGKRPQLHPNFEVGIGSPCYKLVAQLQYILSNYGIASKIYEEFSMTKQKNRFWKLRIMSAPHVLKFMEEIGIYDKISDSDIQDIKDSMKYKSHLSPNAVRKIERIGEQVTYDITVANAERHSFLTNNTIVSNCRQVGASVVTGSYAFWRANFQKAQNIKIISLTLNDALEFKEKTIDINYEMLPGFLKSKATRDGQSRTKLKLVNKSQIRVLAKSKNAGRGGTPSLIIIDEAAFNEWMEEIWKSIEPSLDKGGDCIVISTTNGVGNWYHLTYTRAEQQLNEFHSVFIPWWRYPGRSNPWLQDILDGKIDNPEKFVLEKQEEQLSYMGNPKDGPWLWKRRANAKSEKEFRQEILAEFLGSGNTVISAKTIGEMEKDIEPPQWEDRLPQEAILKPMPGLWCWKDADPHHMYTLVADVAKGSGSDYSAFHIFDVNDNEQVAEYKALIPTRDYAILIKDVARYYNNAYVIIESTGLGISVFNEVYLNDADPYQSVYVQQKGKVLMGWETHPRSRPLLIDDLFHDVENKQTKIHSSRFMEEIKVFIWSEDGKPEAMKGYNDDLVMSYSIYCHLHDYVLTSKPIGISSNHARITDPVAEVKYTKILKQVELVESTYGCSYEDYCWLNGIDIPEEYRQYKEEMDQ